MLWERESNPRQARLPEEEEEEEEDEVGAPKALMENIRMQDKEVLELWWALEGQGR